MRVWYTSDIHFEHIKVAQIRGFTNTEQHDNAIIANWNNRVRPQDTVWLLGDVCMRSAGLEKVKLLNGSIHLITGNHDGPFPGHRDSHKAQSKWLGYFQSVQPFARRRAEGIEFLLSHFPYSTDHTDTDRYTQFRLRDEGMFLVHGHIHSTAQYNLTTRPRQLHVGVDAWGLEPVPQEYVIEFFQEAT